MVSEGGEGEESLVLGGSRDNKVQQEDGKMQEETERGFVEYEDYQEGDEVDLLPDPGLTVDYEDEGWHGWEEGLGGPGLNLKEIFNWELFKASPVFPDFISSQPQHLDKIILSLRMSATTSRSVAPSAVCQQAKSKPEVPPGPRHPHTDHQPRPRGGRPPHPCPPPIHGLHHPRREQGAATGVRGGGRGQGGGGGGGGGDVGQ